MTGSVVGERRLHPVVAGAAEGRLPSWARATPARREHMARVAELMGGWAETSGLGPGDRLRWRALGYLHDALRDAPEAEVRGAVRPPLDALPGPVLHGPAAAERLAAEGVDDPELLNAVRYHTLGHPDLGPAGRALYVADFLEPGRSLKNEWRSELRGRMPHDVDAVLKEILSARILHLVGAGRPVRPETIAFWNAMAGGEAWARASEV